MSAIFTAKDAEMLRTHLAALITVEFFTIPFYLTATYSFTNEALAYSEDGGVTRPLYDLQQNALSVAVQEMYHLQIACNLANAFCEFTPDDIPALVLPAGEKIPIPHLDPDNQELYGMLGDLPAAIQTMITIETADPSPTYPAPNATATYPSISDLYHAALSLLADYWNATSGGGDDPWLNPDSPQVSYGTFTWTYNFNTVHTKDDVMHTINAVTDQGEGKVLPPPNLLQSGNLRLATLARFVSLFKRTSDDCSGDPDCVDPEFRPAAGTRFAPYGAKTHYARFVDIGNEITTWTQKLPWPIFYTDGTPSSELPAWVLKKYKTIDEAYDQTQIAVNTVWSALIDAMRDGFKDGSLNDGDGTDGKASFNDLMLTFKYSLPLLWQMGKTPSFIYVPPALRINMQDALDAVDPYCVVHWDTETAQLRAQPGFIKNACEGLNTCKGMGWGGLGTQPGDGACATADFHTCGGGNACSTTTTSQGKTLRSGQGGCGFLSTQKKKLYPYEDQWTPGENTCRGHGGCQTPISSQQRFAHSDDVTQQIKDSDFTTDQKNALLALRGTDVWTHARELLATELGVSVPDLPTPKTGQGAQVVYDGDIRRAQVYPSSQ